MNVDVVHPWALALLFLAVLPLLRHGHRVARHPAIDWLPEDSLSRLVEAGLRVAAALAIIALVLGIAGLHRPAYQVDRIGRGAQIVLVLDRSLSMDQPFSGAGLIPALAHGSRESKGKVARVLLSRFVERRHQDMFGMVIFSTFPIATLPLTEKQAMVQAVIKAGDVGRGLAETDIGAGLERALEYFEGKRYRGSRIVVLVSDGAGELNLATRLRISHLMKRHRVSLYWIFIRSANGPGIFASESAQGLETIAPARALHEFFSQMGVPYRAYTAENPSGMEQAIADVGRLQNLPIRYQDLVPRQDLSQQCYFAAFCLVGLLVGARLMERQAWR